MFEVLLATLNIKKKYKAKQIGVSLTSKKKKNEYVLLQLHEFDEKVNITNFFLHLMPYTQETTLGIALGSTNLVGILAFNT